MHPALAGVIVPTVWLVFLAAIPYLDRSKEGQGSYFATANSIRISIFSGIFAAFGTITLILLDSGKHTKLYESIMTKLADWGILGQRFTSAIDGRVHWPVGKDRPNFLPDSGFIFALWDLLFSRNFRAIQTEWKWSIPVGGLQAGKGPHDGRLDWPQDFTQIPIPLINGTSWPWHWAGHHGDPPPQWWRDLPGWLTGLYPLDLNWNLPAFVVEQFIPTMFMLGLPALLIFILWRIGWARTRRDVMLSLFSGFIIVYWTMTIVGAAFRGAGQDLVLPWQVPHIDG